VIKQVTLDSVAEIVKGVTFSKDDGSLIPEEGRLPVIRAGSIQHALLVDEGQIWVPKDKIKENQLIRKNDIVMCTSSGSAHLVGKCAKANEDWAGSFGAFCAGIRTDESLCSSSFLYYFLCSPKFRNWSGTSSGANIKNIRTSELAKFKIPLPPLETQKQIAAVLEKADQLRKDCKQMEQELNSLAQSVFIDMFGDPVTNPKGWRTEKLVNLIDSERGVSYGVVQRGLQADEGVPLVRISDFTNNFFNASNLVKCEKEISDKYSRTILKGGELLISIRGTVGRVAIVPDSAKEWNVSREVAIIPTLDKSKNYFLYDLLLSAPIQREILGQVKGVAQSGINLSDLRELPIIQPSEKVLKDYQEKIGARDVIKQALINKRIETEELFDSLMQKAFKGELSLKSTKKVA
jgi:type I restriction enzyme S subunit